MRLYQDIRAAGDFVWNEDSTQVVFAAGYGQETGYEDDILETSIVVLTPENMQLQTILQRDERMLIPDFSPYKDDCCFGETTIELMPIDYDTTLGSIDFRIDFQTGEVYVTTPTQEVTPQPLTTPKP